MMLIINSVLVFLAVALACPEHKDPFRETQGQQAISRKQWVEDLEFFTQRIDSIHPDPYHAIARERFLKECMRVKRLIRNHSDRRIIVEFHRLIALLNDGHTRFIGKTLSSRWYPVRFEKFADGLFITAADNKYADLIGSKIISVCSTPADSVFKSLLDIAPGDNIYGRRYFAPIYLMMNSVMSGLNLTCNGNSLFIEVENHGTLSAVEIKPGEFDSGDDLAWFWRDYGVPAPNYSSILNLDPVLPLWLRNYNKPFWFEYLEASETVYFGFNECTEDGFIEFNKALWNFIDSANVKNLVIDLRNNFGGTNSYLNPFIEEIINHKKINSYGHLFVITGGKTFSAAMHCAIRIEQRCNAIFAGEPTGARPNHYADADFSFLPNSRLLLMVSKQYWENTSPDDTRLALEPDWLIDRFSSDYFNYVDPVMERIIEYLSNH